MILLISKVPNPEKMTQFRLISLCNKGYKVITKIQVRRLRPFLDEFISPFQVGFMSERKAADNVVILRGAVSRLKARKGRTGLMVIKLDLDKANNQ